MANPISGIDEAGDAVRKVIRAYHGSPYDFDRFDASKIGTGEGAQAWGPGLYFAENPKVAEEYKRNIPLHPQYQSPEQMAADYLFVHKTPDDAMRVMRDHGSWKGPRVRREMFREAMQLIRDGAPITPKEFPFSETPPRMYEVEIAHSPASMLDYDAPLTRQNERVRSVLNADRLIDSAVEGGTIGPDFDPNGPIGPMLVGHSAAGGRQAAFDVFADLRKAGVPGIRYLDGFSRGKGDGTRNYVMFPGTEDSIRILRKYGLMAPIAAGAMQEER
jgi:hypothetical protein